MLGTKVGASTTTTYTWDYNNRLTQARGGGATSTYAYDPSGQRIKSVVSTGTSVTTFYPTKNYNISSTTPTKHIFLPDGTMLATVVGTGATTTVSYIHTDHLGGSNVITDSSASIKQLTDYYPYGNTRLDQKTGTGEQRKYIGQEYDPAAALNYLNARYYNGTNGKFISQDPYFISVKFDLTNPQSFNSYSYAGNNPVVSLDPNGNVYFDAKSLGQNIAGFGIGVIQGGYGFYSNIKNTVNHPYDSFVAGRQGLDNVSALITNGIIDPKGTAQAVSQGFSDSYDSFDSKNAYDQGNVIGNFTGQVQAGILAGAALNKGLQIVENEISYSRAATHAIDRSHYPGLSKSEITDIARNTYNNADTKISIAGPKPKQYYFDSTKNNLFINNTKQPTIFKPDSGYLNRAVVRDIERGGVSE